MNLTQQGKHLTRNRWGQNTKRRLNPRNHPRATTCQGGHKGVPHLVLGDGIKQACLQSRGLSHFLRTSLLGKLRNGVGERMLVVPEEVPKRLLGKFPHRELGG